MFMYRGPAQPANVPQPSISNFVATPNPIINGGASILSATVTNATSLTLNGVPVVLPRTVTPTQSTVYTLIASSSVFGTTPATAVITLVVNVANPTITNFLANPNVISTGGSAVLSATLTNTVQTLLDGVPTSLPATVTPAATHGYTLTAIGAPGTTPATANTSVVVTSGGPIAYSTTLVPWNGSFSTLASSKHANAVVMGDGNAYLFPKDCASQTFPADAQNSPDGNQEMYRFLLSQNRMDIVYPYFIPDNTLLQANNPDDAFCIRRVDPSNGVEEMFYFFSVTTLPDPGIHFPPPGNYAQQINPAQTIAAWRPPYAGGNPTYGTWRVAGPNNNRIEGDRSWRGWWDDLHDKFVIPVNTGGQTGFVILNGATLADETDYDGSLPWSFGVFAGYSGGVAVDRARRQVYLFDNLSTSVGRVSMDAIINKTRSGGNYPQIVTPPLNPSAAPLTDQYGGKICWSSAIDGWVYPLHETWYAWRPIDGVLQSFLRQDGRFSDWVPPGTFVGNGGGPWINSYDTFEDPATLDIITYDWIDFNQPENKSLITGWYRNHFTLGSSLPSWVPALGTVGPISLNSIQQVYNAQIGPGPWDTGSGVAPVITAWNSGIFCPAYGSMGGLFVIGAGDQDGFLNCGFILDIATQTFVKIGIPSPQCANVSGFNLGNATYSDGTPGVGHTYGQVQYLPPSLGGGVKGSVVLTIRSFWYHQETSGANISFRLDLNTQTWSQCASNGASNGHEGSSCFDSLRSRFVEMETGPSSPTGRLRALGNFNPATGVGSWADFAMADNFLMGGDASLCYAPNQDAVLALGKNEFNAWGIRAWDMASNTPHDLTFTGDAFPGIPGAGFCWSSLAQCFFIKSPAQNLQQVIWRLTPPSSNPYGNPWVVTAITMPGTALPQPAANAINGMWQRLQEIPSIKCVAWVNDVNQLAYGYRVVS